MVCINSSLDLYASWEAEDRDVLFLGCDLLNEIPGCPVVYGQTTWLHRCTARGPHPVWGEAMFSDEHSVRPVEHDQRPLYYFKDFVDAPGLIHRLRYAYKTGVPTLERAVWSSDMEHWLQVLVENLTRRPFKDPFVRDDKGGLAAIGGPNTLVIRREGKEVSMAAGSPLLVLAEKLLDLPEGTLHVPGGGLWKALDP